MDIPFEELSEEVLRKIIEEFVLREGTDYGAREFSLDEKVEHVLGQLKRKKVKIVFDAQDQTCSVVTV